MSSVAASVAAFFSKNLALLNPGACISGAKGQYAKDLLVAAIQKEDKVNKVKVNRTSESGSDSGSSVVSATSTIPFGDDEVDPPHDEVDPPHVPPKETIIDVLMRGNDALMEHPEDLLDPKDRRMGQVLRMLVGGDYASILHPEDLRYAREVLKDRDSYDSMVLHYAVQVLMAANAGHPLPTKIQGLELDSLDLLRAVIVLNREFPSSRFPDWIEAYDTVVKEVSLVSHS